VAVAVWWGRPRRGTARPKPRAGRGSSARRHLQRHAEATRDGSTDLSFRFLHWVDDECGFRIPAESEVVARAMRDGPRTVVEDDDCDVAVAGLDDVLRRDADVRTLPDDSRKGVRVLLVGANLLGANADRDISGAALQRAGPDADRRPVGESDRVGADDAPREQVRDP